MATNPIPTLHADDHPLTTPDEWWDYVMSLQGSAKEMLAEVGGADAWIRFLREGDPEDADD